MEARNYNYRNTLHWQIRFILMLTILFTSGCATYPEVDNIPPIDEKNTNSFSIQPPVEIAPYKLHGGDIIAINVYQRSNFQELLSLNNITVGPDGRISLPTVGNIFVAGMDLDELRTTLEQRLSAHFVSPVIHVAITLAGGYNVSILGQVMKPGIYTIQWDTSAIEAILSAGGFNKTAEVSKVILIRPKKTTSLQKEENLSSLAVRMNIEKLLTQADIYQNVVLQPGDLLYVPTTEVAQSAQFNRQIADIISPYLSTITTLGNLILINRALTD